MRRSIEGRLPGSRERTQIGIAANTCAARYDWRRTLDIPHRLQKGYGLLSDCATDGSLPFAQERRRLTAGQFAQGDVEALLHFSVEVEPMLMR